MPNHGISWLETLIHKQKRLILKAAAAYNITGGLLLILAVFIFGSHEKIFELIESGYVLLFVGGTAITFGIGYFQSARRRADARTVLLYGCGLKYWAFIIIFFAYIFSNLWVGALVLAGFGNLIFAILFTILLRRETR
jgi:hypothetical protein